MKKFISLLFLLIFISCKNDLDFILKNIKKYEKNISQHKSIDYDLDYKIKLYSSEDTLKYKVHCTLVRNLKDTIFGGAIWIGNDSIERYYDLKNIYLINHNRNEIIKFFPKKKQLWVMSNQLISEVYKIYFLKPNKLTEKYNDKNIITTFENSIIKKNKYQIISFKNKVENYTKDLFIKNNHLEIMNFYIKDLKQNENQFNQWKIYNTKYDTLTLMDLNDKLDFYKKKYTIRDFKEPKKKELLENGKLAPNIRGKYFPNKKKFILYEKNNKITILDFWYKDCEYCITSTSFLNKMKLKFSNKGLHIYGLNPIDTKAKDSTKLYDFIKNNGINYSTILINKKIALDYNIEGFPTFYIINSENKIIYSHKGFQKKDEIIIEEIIRKNL